MGGPRRSIDAEILNYHRSDRSPLEPIGRSVKRPQQKSETKSLGESLSWSRASRSAVSLGKGFNPFTDIEYVLRQVKVAAFFEDWNQLVEFRAGV